MQRLVITTVGTSLLTNQIDRTSNDEKSWSEELLRTAHYTDEMMLDSEQHLIDIIEDLKIRAENQLNGDIEDFRKASAELNGIYGLYNNKIEKAKSDHHCLIYTDTAQGRYCAMMLEKFLKSKGINNIEMLYSENFSTNSNEQFMQGIANLLPILKQKILEDYQGYTICFNLVGGFKAMQGYFNTIGMLYADEIIYILEGSTNQIITIPKLPIIIDKPQVEKYAIPLAVMDIGKVPISWEPANKVPQDWLTYTGQEIGLSVWGKLIWNECKNELLSQDKLLNFHNFIKQLEYRSSFEDDYKNTSDLSKKIILQEKLAKIAYLLINYRDGISALRTDDALRLRKYEEKPETEHINITKKELRVSCQVINNNKLSLRYFGTHEHIYKKEGIKK